VVGVARPATLLTALAPRGHYAKVHPYRCNMVIGQSGQWRKRGGRQGGGARAQLEKRVSSVPMDNVGNGSILDNTHCIAQSLNVTIT
jgi:hypothetical protein